MIKLPASSFVNKTIPKKKFLENSDVKIKKALQSIEKIIWQNSLSPKTINLPKSQEIEEIQLFKIILRQKETPKQALQYIQKLIPYPILFILEYGDDLAYAIFYKNEFFYKHAELEIDPNAQNMQNLYENIIKAFLDIQKPNFHEAIALQNKIKALQKEIDILKNKIKKEKQFKYKVEMNKRLIQLQKELERLLNE